jgi:DNA replication protein DnaC
MVSAYRKGKENLSCPFCNGDRMFQDKKQGKIHCLCSTLDWQMRLIEKIEPYRSSTTEASLEKMDNREDNSLTTAIEVMQRFVSQLGNWVLIGGSYGCGKTHILRAVDWELWPLTIFVTASEFQSLVFEAIDNNQLIQLTNVFKTVPVLLFDDWGTEYSWSDDNIVASKFREIIDYRYRIWHEFPTVVTTNMSIQQQTRKDPRVASRMMDREKVDVLIVKVDDYRSKPRIK